MALFGPKLFCEICGTDINDKGQYDCNCWDGYGEENITPEIKTITRDQLGQLCCIFHKWFRTADCKNDAGVDMYEAINKMDDKEYAQAMEESLKEIGIVVKE